MARDFNKHYFNEGKAFLDSIVTMDETWLHYSTPEMKSQSRQWIEKGGNPPRKAKVVGSAKKIMFLAFFDSKGMVYQHYVSSGTTINSAYYCEVLAKFLHHLREKRPEKIRDGWLLHQDNARPHTSKETSEFMAKKHINLFEHAPYSPDLAPCDFHLFPKLKMKLAGQKFDTLQALQAAVQGVLQELFENGASHVMEKWHERLTKCIEVSGDYVEK